MKELTREQVNEYVFGGLPVCPFCTAGVSHPEKFEVYAHDEVTRRTGCEECGREWEDVFKIVGVDVPAKGAAKFSVPPDGIVAVAEYLEADNGDNARTLLLVEAYHEFPAFDADAPVNGADLVEWFAAWRRRVGVVMGYKEA